MATSDVIGDEETWTEVPAADVSDEDLMVLSTFMNLDIEEAYLHPAILQIAQECPPENESVQMASQTWNKVIPLAGKHI